jgi:NADH-quinone oxidoreductase subunit G
MSAQTATEIGCVDGDLVMVGTERGRLVLPLAITDMDHRVVWLPLNSPGCAVHTQLGVGPGAVVSIGRAGS